MQYEHHNYSNFIISFAKHFCPKNFIFTLESFIKILNSLIKHKSMLKIKKKSFLIINMFLHEKKSNLHITNQLTT